MLDTLLNKTSFKKSSLIRVKKRLQYRCFPVILAKFLRTFILKNICERLVLKTSRLQKKLLIYFFHKVMTFIIVTITFEALKFLLSFVQLQFLLIYFIKKLVPSFFVNFILQNYTLKLLFEKKPTREKILEQFTFTQKLSCEKFPIGRNMQLKSYLLYLLKSFLVRSFKPEERYN